MDNALIYWVSGWIATIFLLLFLPHRRRRVNLPPGPKPWPIIGNLNLIGSLPHQSIHQLSKKYGPIMQLRFGSFPVVVGSSVEMAKIFLKNHDLNFVYRPNTAAGKYITYNNSNITWSQYGPYWRQGRKIFLTELFSPKRLDSFEYIRKQETKVFLREIYESCGKGTAPTIIQLKVHLSALSMNVISRMALGKKYLDQSNFIMSPNEFKEMMDELFFLSGAFNVGDLIPWMNFLDLQGYVKRMKVLSKKLDRFLEHIIDEHNERRIDEMGNFVAKDMVDVLLQLADDPNLEVKLERNGIKALTLDLIAGGTESSTLTIEWAMSEMLKKPETFNKATEELDRVIGRERWVEEKDIANLPFIKAIAKETMRLHPVVPMLVPRLCHEDCKIEGFDIAKGTRVFVNVWSIGRDPKVWENSNEFCPQRFLVKNVDVKGQSFELLPFGSGRRMCPGYNLGFKVILSSLANLLHGFSWTLPPNMKNEDLNMEEVFGLTTPRKFPLLALAHPRLPLHVYYNLE